MRRASIGRSLGRAAVSATALALPLGPVAAAAAGPPPPPVTTVFPTPVGYLSGCLSNIFPCYSVPPLTTVTPTATPTAPGTVTFATTPPTRWWTGTLGCLDVSVNWRNLTTGAAGSTVLHVVPPDYRRPVPLADRCRYAPATAVTGSGAVVATADVGAQPPAGGYQILVSRGFGGLVVP
ncbi:hypothetical protein ACFWPA_11875 [Rhodococcus sp. NPDC058505]|uniref:hypothetical protein n=1 Tax=unclassified Rhodococcus (in: high G+C Gram-positive bacteria) TaxID=192944 RepID=UPI0036500D92